MQTRIETSKPKILIRKTMSSQSKKAQLLENSSASHVASALEARTRSTSIARRKTTSFKSNSSSKKNTFVKRSLNCCKSRSRLKSNNKRTTELSMSDYTKKSSKTSPTTSNST